jgi:hypothetical protein
MKKLHLLWLVLLTITTTVSMSTFAQSAKTTHEKIFINAKGGIHNHAGTKLGYIDKDGIVRDNQGEKLYFVDKDGNVITADGKKLGKAKKNGDYYNIKGETILTVKDKNAEECEILDPKGHNLGTTHKNYKQHACTAHCYALTKAEKKTLKKS